MASKVKTFKLQTYEKLKKFKVEFPTRKEFKKSPQYESFVNSFLNSVEREYIDEIVDMFYDGKTYDNIREFIQEKENQAINDVFADGDESNEEKEAFLILSQNKVIEVDPVDVLIGDDDTDDQSSQTIKNVADDLKREALKNKEKIKKERSDLYDNSDDEENVKTLKIIAEERKHKVEDKLPTWVEMLDMICRNSHRVELSTTLAEMLSKGCMEEDIIKTICMMINDYASEDNKSNTDLAFAENQDENVNDNTNINEDNGFFGDKLIDAVNAVKEKTNKSKDGNDSESAASNVSTPEVNKNASELKSKKYDDQYTITCGVANETIFSRLSAIW